MTEADWLASHDPVEVIGFLPHARSDRQFILLACALFPKAMRGPAEERHLFALHAAERLADGAAGAQELARAQDAAHDIALRFVLPVPHRSRDPEPYLPPEASHPTPKSAVLFAAIEVGYFGPGWVPDPIQGNAICELVRDIFGNPFDPVIFAPEWRTPTTVAIARGMYESRDFGAMPILADAFQDAGCDSDDVLNHCRGPGAHVRGCWVVDVVLGKG